MKKLLIILFIISSFNSKGTIHQIGVWGGYYQFVPGSITIQLGDTIEWEPFFGLLPMMLHTITSDNIPAGAVSFDQVWQMPADTFFQYIPQVAGLYQYVCTPHIPNGMIGEFTVTNGFNTQTYVPDDNFENYLEANGMGDGIALNDSVNTSNISSVTHLWVNNESISDLTGIEGFSSLELLSAQDNNLTSLDLSINLNLEVLEIDNNYLTSLDFFGQDLVRLNCNNNQITNLFLDSMSLTNIHIGGNPIASFDATLHPNLETLEIYASDIDSIDLSQNPNLEFLSISGGNLLSLDLSNNPQLTFFDSWGNSFYYLDVRNGNNHNMSFVIGDAYNLTCINVDDENWANANWFSQLNSWNYFSNNCSGTTAIQEGSINKKILKITDLLARETKQTNQPLLYIYSDGTIEKKIIIE